MPHVLDISTVEINPEALDLVPESIAREMCILPTKIGDSYLHVIHPVDADATSMIGKLQFILNREIGFDTADRRAIVAAIDRYYPTPRQAAEKVTLPEALPTLDKDTDYAFMDLIGRLAFSTAASVSFDLGQECDYIEYADGSRKCVGDLRVFEIVGWLDAHYPCKGFHKLFVRCSLPGHYVGFEAMRDMISAICAVLRLPATVPYKIRMQAGSSGASMENPQEGFICTTKWRMPDEPELIANDLL